MTKLSGFVFAAAVLLYLPTVRYGFVQDDRAIIVSNPAVHSLGAAIAAFDDPYWPPESGAGLYRPVTILTYAVDWAVSGGRPGWFHVMNALWHGLATVLLALVLARWLPPLALAGASLLFAWHPVHVEAVASLVGRAELLVACGILGGVLAARRGRWTIAVLCAALAMFAKEHGVIAGVVILLDRWLEPTIRPPSPEGRGGQGVRTPEGRRGQGVRTLWIGLAVVTVGFLAAWFAIGWVGVSDEAAVFYGRDAAGRLAIALPAALRAVALLFWPMSLSVDYNPQVIPLREGFSFAALLGVFVLATIAMLVVWSKRRAPVVAFGAALMLLSYLPTSNLAFPSGVVLAERNLYLAVVLPAALLGSALGWSYLLRGSRAVIAALALVTVACGARSLDRLPAWRDNRSQLLTLLAEHPESYRGHASAAAVLAGVGDTAGARREYRAADSLYRGDPYVDAAHAIFLIGLGDTAAAAPLVLRARDAAAGDRIALRAEFLLALARGRRSDALALADSARRQFPTDSTWYVRYLQ